LQKETEEDIALQDSRHNELSLQQPAVLCFVCHPVSAVHHLYFVLASAIVFSISYPASFFNACEKVMFYSFSLEIGNFLLDIGHSPCLWYCTAHESNPDSPFSENRIFYFFNPDFSQKPKRTQTLPA